MVIVKSVQRVKSIFQLKKYNFKKDTLVYAMQARVHHISTHVSNKRNVSHRHNVSYCAKCQ